MVSYITMQLVVLQITQQQLHHFVDIEIRPVAARAADDWDNALEKTWKPYVEIYNSHINQTQLDINKSLQQVNQQFKYN